jgi:two-component system, OmpR family, response regulator
VTQSKRILIVDDEPDIREILSMCLDLAEGWTVSLARSGAECLQMAPKLQPDLIVLDSMMPGMDGMGTLERLREHPQCAETTVVLLSAKTHAEADPALLRLGVSGTLQKPFNPATISDQLRAFLAR